jgi:transcription termination factor Rho
MTENETDLIPGTPHKLRAAKKKAPATKTAVKKPAAAAPAEEPAAEPKAPAKTAAKKAAPAKKAAAKKTIKAVAPAEPAPEPAPVKAAPAKKVAAKKVAKKAAAKAPAAEEPAPAPAPTPAPPPPPAPVAEEAAAAPAKKRITIKRRAAQPESTDSGDSPAPSADTAPAAAPEPAADAAQPAGEGRHGAPHDRQPGPPPLGPDGQPRRLTKWERWKLRKEKFKLMKQQRYLEKQARMQDGGENGPGPHEESSPEGERPPRPEIQLSPPEDCAGLLELTPGKGFGFLRPKERNFAPLPTDPFVTPEMVRNLGLRDGLWVEAVMRRGGRGPQVVDIKSVNGRSPDSYRMLPLFEELTAINPNKRYILECESRRYTTRLIDFIAPIGRGQRGLIVAPPRAGKTTILQHIAESVRHNYPDIKLMVVLIDERPEEVTEIARALPGAEIMASNNDRDPRDHIRIAALAMERARRLVEAGDHVFILLDSITRLARAFNNAIRGGGGGKGGSLSGGVDARALEGARRMFASARNTREAGSLTIVGTALVETNSRADELIFQEFKGTGNMELVLDRKIAQQYIYPAVDIFKSGTRREELLLPPHQMEKVHVIRRGLAGHKPVEAVERLIHFMDRFPTNAQMLVEIKSRE